MTKFSINLTFMKKYIYIEEFVVEMNVIFILSLSLEISEIIFIFVCLLDNFMHVSV